MYLGSDFTSTSDLLVISLPIENGSITKPQFVTIGDNAHPAFPMARSDRRNTLRYLISNLAISSYRDGTAHVQKCTYEKPNVSLSPVALKLIYPASLPSSNDEMSKFSKGF